MAIAGIALLSEPVENAESFRSFETAAVAASKN
jgi:hypothetical protein